MALWLRTGTASFTNASTTVNFTGVNLISANVRVGDALHGPDGRVYEIDSINTATQVTLASAYQGATAAAQNYAIQPTRGVATQLYNEIQTLIASVSSYLSGILAGRFPAGTAAAPAIAAEGDGNTGINWPAADQVAMAAGGVNRVVATAQGATITGLLSGTAVQSGPSDATVGRLLKVGASATLLSASPALRMTRGGAGNIVNLTTGAGFTSITEGFLLRWRAAEANTMGVTINVDGTGAVEARTVTGVALPAGYIRTDVDTWAMYDGTHWIVEREPEAGTNANGRYLRLANGFQQCSHSLSTGDTGPATWTYPAAFSAAPIVTPTAGAASARLATWQTATASNVGINGFTDAGVRSVFTVSVTATGSWY